jgi:ribosomal protein S9
MQGEGKFIVNEKQLAEYFTRLGDTQAILQPFASTGENQAQYDVTVIVNAAALPVRHPQFSWGLHAHSPK